MLEMSIGMTHVETRKANTKIVVQIILAHGVQTIVREMMCTEKELSMTEDVRVLHVIQIQILRKF